MTNRRTGAVLTVLISLAATVLLAACSQAPEPEPSATASGSSASGSASPSAPLRLGESGTVAGLELTPAAVRTRKGPVYDSEGVAMDGTGLVMTIEVVKTREPDLSAGELTVPVASLVSDSGEAVRMDDLFGMVPMDAQSDEYNNRYAESYNYACIQSPGKTTKGTLWFSLPEGFVPETLIIDGGAGAQAAWLLE